MRIRPVDTIQEMERLIDELITLGYGVKLRGEESALLQKKAWGDISAITVLVIIALILSIFTLGLSFLLPIAYVVYKHQTAQKVMIKINRASNATASYTTTPITQPEPHVIAYQKKPKIRVESLRLTTLNQVDLVIALIVLLWGMLAGVVIALPIEVLSNAGAWIAGLIEEPAKLLPLIAIALWYPYLLYSKKKCALFGAVAGLGFGALENLWYFLQVPTEELGITVIGRTAFLPMHMMYSAIAAMSLLYVASRHQRYYTVILFSLAVLFHTVWDSVYPAVGVYIILYAVIIALFILVYNTVPDRVTNPGETPTRIDDLFKHKSVQRSELP